MLPIELAFISHVKAQGGFIESSLLGLDLFPKDLAN